MVGSTTVCVHFREFFGTINSKNRAQKKRPLMTSCPFAPPNRKFSGEIYG